MNKGLELYFQYYLTTPIKRDIHTLKEMTCNRRSDGPDLPKFHTIIIRIMKKLLIICFRLNWSQTYMYTVYLHSEIHICCEIYQHCKGPQF